MSESIMDESEEQQVFQKSQLVWAKILGWPWWPGRITQIPSQKNGNYKVQFFADTSHAFLPQDKLLPYAQWRDKYSTPKGHHRNFAKALSQADKLLQITSTPKDETRTHYMGREKLPDQQIQIINQSQQVESNSKPAIEQKQSQQFCSYKIVIRAKFHRMRKHSLCHRQRNGLINRKKQIQKKCKQVDELLKQYKLDFITKQSQKNGQHKLIKKRKIIGKKNSQKCDNSIDNEIKLTRMIYKALSVKQIPQQERQTIAIELMRSFYRQQQKQISGIHRALFQWIRCNDAETIQQNYKLWPTEIKLDNSTDLF